MSNEKSVEESNLNVAVLRGELHRPPQWRQLRDEQSVTTFDLKVRSSVTGRNEFLRVSWLNAPTDAMNFREGDHLVVGGIVRTYWSGKRSETDVLAQFVSRAQLTKQVRKLIANAMTDLQAACP